MTERWWFFDLGSLLGVIVLSFANGSAHRLLFFVWICGPNHLQSLNNESEQRRVFLFGFLIGFTVVSRGKGTVRSCGFIV